MLFDFGLPLDITPVSTPPHFQEYRDKGRTQLSDRELSPAATHIVDREPRLGQFRLEAATPTELEILHDTRNSSIGDTDLSNIDETRDSRITLLIQKYEGAATIEDSARLDILTQRLRQLSPRSGPYDIEILSAMVDEVEQVSDDINKLREKYK